MTDRTTSAVLLEAAAILERDGWCRGRCGPVEGPNCALGAIRKAAGSIPHLHNDLSRDAVRLFERAKRLPSGALIIWNDAPGRTASEVIAKLREAAGASP